MVLISQLRFLYVSCVSDFFSTPYAEEFFFILNKNYASTERVLGGVYMSRMALQLTRSQVRRWLLVQTVVVISAALVFLVWKDVFFARSVLVGGCVCLLPQWVFARIWFAFYQANAATELIKMFYIGGMVKLLLTGALFILALQFIALNVIGCLIGFILAQLAFWLAPLFFAKRQMAASSLMNKKNKRETVP